MTSNDIHEQSSARTLEEFLESDPFAIRSRKGGEVGISSSVSFHADDMAGIVQAEKERKQREEAAEYRGREYQRKRYEDTMATRHLCPFCHYYGIYEQLPWPNNLLDAAIEECYPETSGQNHKHLRAHIANAHEDKTREVWKLWTKLSDARQRLQYLEHQSEQARFSAKTSNVSRAEELLVDVKSWMKYLQNTYRDDREVLKLLEKSSDDYYHKDKVLVRLINGDPTEEAKLLSVGVGGDSQHE